MKYKGKVMKNIALYFNAEHHEMLKIYSKYNGTGSFSMLINDIVDTYIQDNMEDIDKCLRIEMKK
jgi:hypothetical protein